MKIEEIKQIVSKVASDNDVHVSKVTIKMIEDSSELTEWELRKVGGLNAIKKLFPFTDKDLAQIKQNKTIESYVRTLENRLAEKDLLKKSLLETVTKSISGINVDQIKVSKRTAAKKKPKMTMELMISDVHYGKKTDTFNLKVCRERMRHLASVFLSEMDVESKTFDVEKVIVAIIGDICESYSMHGLESAVGCEFGNSKQVSSAIESLFYDIILPIAKTGVKVDVPCVTGNHDRTEHNRTFNEPGLNNLTWIIYQSLRMLCEQSGLKNVTFFIPEGPYVILPIYNNFCLYEHGDNSKAPTKAAFEALLDRRSRQENKVIHFSRFGHFHEYAMFDRGRIIVNESVCGNDSYANVKGYNSSPGQTINFYVETKTRPNCFYKSFPVYLG